MNENNVKEKLEGKSPELTREEYKQLVEAAFHHTLGSLGEVSFRIQQLVQVYTGDLPDVESLLLRTERAIEACNVVLPVLDRIKAGCLHVRKKGGRIDE